MEHVVFVLSVIDKFTPVFQGFVLLGDDFLGLQRQCLNCHTGDVAHSIHDAVAFVRVTYNSPEMVGKYVAGEKAKKRK
jgi:hypothetical protein